ncbi:MAG: helical backbone metal receptor [Halioglobus sp.]|nr:helical backbone metal receptor [Halioglobus sp.]
MQPDLVVMWGSGNGGGTLSRLVNLNIPVYVSELRDLADIPASIRRLGTLAGTSEVSEAEAARLERELEELQQNYGGGPPLKVFYQIWHEPLQTVNGEHLISQVLALCGGRNLFAGARSLAPRISVESVLVRNPDAIVAGGMGEGKAGLAGRLAPLSISLRGVR